MTARAPKVDLMTPPKGAGVETCAEGRYCDSLTHIASAASDTSGLQLSLGWWGVGMEKRVVPILRQPRAMQYVTLNYCPFCGASVIWAVKS